MTISSSKHADWAGCTVLQALDVDACGTSTSLAGQSLEIEFRRFAANESLQASEENEQREEIAAVLEGSFEIRASGECFLLTKGEAVIVPPGTRSLWRCVEGPGVLYRVLARDASAAALGK